MEAEIIEELQSAVKAALESLKVDLGKLRTGRASISLLDGVRVDYYGSPTPLAQLATLNTPDARLITIKPFDKSVVTDVEKAIQKAGLGLNPQSDGQLIRVPIPALTEDRRKDIVKQGKARAEDAKISMRNARRDANELLKEAEKDKEISQDDLKRALEKVQHLTDAGVTDVDKMVAAKEKEILEL